MFSFHCIILQDLCCFCFISLYINTRQSKIITYLFLPTAYLILCWDCDICCFYSKWCNIILWCSRIQSWNHFNQSYRYIKLNLDVAGSWRKSHKTEFSVLPKQGLWQKIIPKGEQLFRNPGNSRKSIIVWDHLGSHHFAHNVLCIFFTWL